MLLQAIIGCLRHPWLASRINRRINTGQGLVEYALILVFVAVVMVIVMSILGPGIANIYSNIVSVLNSE